MGSHKPYINTKSFIYDSCSLFRGEDENTNIRWDGIEVKLVSLLADLYNFTIEFKLAKDAERLRYLHTLVASSSNRLLWTFSSGDAVVLEVTKKKANLGIAGLYTTSDRIDIVDVAWSHYQDCAAFISLTSTALPKWLIKLPTTNNVNIYWN